jgi:hypothetical protein
MESKRLGKLLGISAAALTAIAVGVPLVQAETASPKYRQFVGCPSPKSENPEISSCIRVTFGSGQVRLGKREIPLKSSMSLSGGSNESLGNFSFNSRGGLMPVKQPISIGSPALSALFSARNVDPQLYAVVELVGSPALGGGLFADAQLSLRFHLLNGALSDSCYIGSNANPIRLSLTTGTTAPPPPVKPITGKEAAFRFDFPTERGLLTGGTFVANAFSVPGAEGCLLRPLPSGLTLKVNGLINEAFGLPAPAGASQMALNFDVEFVEAGLVYP